MEFDKRAKLDPAGSRPIGEAHRPLDPQRRTARR